MPAQFTNRHQVGIHAFQIGRVGQVIDGDFQVFKGFDLVGGIQLVGDYQVGFQAGDLFQIIFTIRSADIGKGLGLRRVIGEIVPPDHLCACANSEQDLSIGRRQGDDSGRRSIEGDRALQAIRKAEWRRSGDGRGCWRAVCQQEAEGEDHDNRKSQAFHRRFPVVRFCE